MKRALLCAVLCAAAAAAAPAAAIGGPAGPSALCTNEAVIDNTLVGVRTWVYVQTVSSTTTWVCVRAENGGDGFGGRLVIDSSVSLPTPPPLPQPDTDVGACTATTPNSVPTTHPIDSGTIAGQTVLFDLYRDGGQDWVCLQVGASSERVVITEPSSGLPTLPSVTWNPDPGTP